MAFLPESPVWLRSKERYEDANASAAWLKLPLQEKPIPENSRYHQNESKDEDNVSYFTRPIMLPLAIGLTLLVLQQISGIDAIIFFTVEIFRAAGICT